MPVKMSVDSFEWPWQYNFPPFYTIQPNQTTREKQIEIWKKVVLNYCKDKRIFIVDVDEICESELFNNKELKRHLNKDGVCLILNELKNDNRLEWINKSKTRCFVYWRTLNEWANLLQQYVQENGLTDTVCTLYELISGKDTEEQEFHGIDRQLLIRVITVLQAEGKAELMLFDDMEGVKFL